MNGFNKVIILCLTIFNNVKGMSSTPINIHMTQEYIILGMLALEVKSMLI